MPYAPLLQPDSVIARSPDQLAGEIDNQYVILDIATGQYFHFNDVASRIWSLLATPKAVGALLDCLRDEFAVDRGTCDRQVIDFLRDLLAHGLIRADHSPSHPDLA